MLTGTSARTVAGPVERFAAREQPAAQRAGHHGQDRVVHRAAEVGADLPEVRELGACDGDPPVLAQGGAQR